MSDPFDILRDHLRRQADLAEPETGTDELIAHITLEHHRRPSASWPETSRRRRRWKSVAIGVAVSLGIGAGAVVTAAVLDKERVRSPQAGVVCRVSATDQRRGYATDAGDDPIAVCRALWNSGRLPLIDEISDGSDPDLIACTGDRGVLEVYPGSGPEVCTAVGLAAADVDSMLADPRRELSERITAEIHTKCLSPEQAAQRAAALLDDLGFAGWRIVQADGEGCGVVTIGADDDHTLYVSPIPPPG